jgi:hypothetical protein
VAAAAERKPLSDVLMLFKPKQMNDPVFGLMKFRRTLGFVGAGFWDAEVDFTPIGRPVKIRVQAGRSGASEKQREFYQELKLRYAELIESIRNVIVDTPLNYYGNNFFGNTMPELKWEDFELYSIGISDLRKSEFEWNLSYLYLPMGETYSVNFEGWKPTYGELDD